MVAGAQRISPLATARRCWGNLGLISTMVARPFLSRWERRFTKRWWAELRSASELRILSERGVVRWCGLGRRDRRSRAKGGVER